MALREGKAIQELLTELQANIGRETEAIEAAGDDLLTGQTRAPWGAEGTLGELIMGTITDHFHTHLVDLRAATA